MDYLRSLKKRFHRKYKTHNSASMCWEWTGALNHYGYGILRNMPGQYPRCLIAHRLSWQLANDQEIPDTMCICHKCDNPKCVNPNHLFIGSKIDNNLDRDSKRRHAFGQKNGNAKLTDTDVIEILKLMAQGQSNPSIAKLFGISRITTWEIAINKRWKHLQATEAE